MTAKDWTEGVEAVLYEACDPCGKAWYFRRGFCPHCGSGNVEVRTSSGHGTVHAVTRVARAPSDEWRALAPYTLVLADMAEGFRMMAHAVDGIRIDDRIRMGWLRFNDTLLPRAEKNP